MSFNNNNSSGNNFIGPFDIACNTTNSTNPFFGQHRQRRQKKTLEQTQLIERQQLIKNEIKIIKRNQKLEIQAKILYLNQKKRQIQQEINTLKKIKFVPSFEFEQEETINHHDTENFINSSHQQQQSPPPIPQQEESSPPHIHQEGLQRIVQYQQQQHPPSIPQQESSPPHIHLEVLQRIIQYQQQQRQQLHQFHNEKNLLLLIFIKKDYNVLFNINNNINILHQFHNEKNLLLLIFI